MNRKLLYFIIIFNLLIFTVPFIIFSQRPPVETAIEEEYEVIPDEAIRLRILAHSDEKRDQDIKHSIRDEVSDQITSWVANVSDIDEARQLIQSQLPEIEAVTENVLQQENNNQAVQVSYSENVTFPVKIYDRFLYPAGEYEAILITLGEGNGSNWWCVLFPPLCFLDFGNGATVADGEDEDDAYEVAQEASFNDGVENTEEDDEVVEVKFFLFEWLGWS